jgi:hypothetical protein
VVRSANEYVNAVARRIINLDYDLGSIPDSERRSFFKSITDPETRTTYHKVEMQLEISVTMAGGVRLDLKTGCQEDFLGNTAREGYRLVAWSSRQEM